VSRSKKLITALVLIAGLAALFAVFIGFKRDAALIAALEAAGTVAAASFAATAAFGSMRAAAESSATARKSREALARTARPHLRPTITTQENGTIFGTIRSGETRAAVDITVVWTLTDQDPVVGQTAHLEPGRTLDLPLPETANPASEITMVWIEYADPDYIGQWRDTWEPDAHGTLALTSSQLVD
jgi:hypothetical protein